MKFDEIGIKPPMRLDGWLPFLEALNRVGEILHPIDWTGTEFEIVEFWMKWIEVDPPSKPTQEWLRKWLRDETLIDEGIGERCEVTLHWMRDKLIKGLIRASFLPSSKQSNIPIEISHLQEIPKGIWLDDITLNVFFLWCGRAEASVLTSRGIGQSVSGFGAIAGWVLIEEESLCRALKDRDSIVSLSTDVMPQPEQRTAGRHPANKSRQDDVWHLYEERKATFTFKHGELWTVCCDISDAIDGDYRPDTIGKMIRTSYREEEKKRSES